MTRTKPKKWAEFLGAGYGKLAGLRVRAYDKGIFTRHRLKIPVISIGNLTFGGTGKTPVTRFLVELFLARGRRPGIVCRTYKTKRQSIQKIDAAESRASEVGDEALWLAQKFPGVPVYSGPRKWETATRISDQEDIDVVLVDDGFQHLALFRDLDILLLDASESSENYLCFPAGRAREEWTAKHRAQIYFLTKCNWASPQNLDFHRRALGTQEVFEFDFLIAGFSDLRGASISVAPSSALVVSAIARPEIFLREVEKYFPAARAEALSYPDHHIFSVRDLEKIRREYQRGFDCILVTEKDGVKLAQLPGAGDLPFRQVQLELAPRFSVESLYAKMHSVLA